MSGSEQQDERDEQDARGGRGGVHFQSIGRFFLTFDLEVLALGVVIAAWDIGGVFASGVFFSFQRQRKRLRANGSHGIGRRSIRG